MRPMSFAVKFGGAAAALLFIAGCAQTPEPVAEAPPAPEEVDTGPAVPSVPAKPVEVEPMDTGPVPGSQDDLVANIGDRVHFAYDRFDLSPEARDILRRQANWLLQHRQIRISVEGHCDERGTREYNLALGERRATAIMNYLVALGVDAGRVETISYGKEQPIDIRSVEAAWAKNRRGVIKVN
ncbi:MAG: peptidoglycan-associated lipoprotein Pal [Sphingomonadales bacterium]